MNFQQILMAAATQAGGAAAAPAAAAWPSLIGAEMLADGDCGSSTGWTEGAGVTVNVVAGKMVATAASSDTANTGIPSATCVAGVTYRNAFTIDSFTGGTARVVTGATNGTLRSSAATFSEDIVATDTSAWKLTFSGATMQLDTFSVKSVGNLGVSADWSFTGDMAFTGAGSGAPDRLSWADNGADTASLTGAALTAFDAAVSNSTACTVTLTGASDVVGALVGTILVSLKGGTPVSFAFNETSNQQVAQTVTSGAGSGVLLDSDPGSPAIANLVRIQIALA